MWYCCVVSTFYCWNFLCLCCVDYHLVIVNCGSDLSIFLMVMLSLILSTFWIFMCIPSVEYVYLLLCLLFIYFILVSLCTLILLVTSLMIRYLHFLLITIGRRMYSCRFLWAISWIWWLVEFLVPGPNVENFFLL